MPPLLKFLIRRFLVIPLTLFVITMLLYGGVMLTPPNARAQLYLPTNSRMTEKQLANLIELIIERYHLQEPFPVQYSYWVGTFFDGTWGYSPSLNEQVLPALLKRTPATAELTLFSLLFIIIPFGLYAGIIAGWHRGYRDSIFQSVAFFATSIPPFILALAFLVIFYINLRWFAPGRLGTPFSYEITKDTFVSPTGMLLVDSLINGRYDIFADALRHLAMPALTLSLYHWATLARITRSAVMEQRRKEYITSAQARGIPSGRILWWHIFRNILVSSLTSVGLSTASLITGVYVVEIIYDLNGVSEIITTAMSSGIPDAPAILGFAVFSVLVVLILMFLLDVIQAVVDPRIRGDMIKP
jgi:ABC-type dipeptide/oligopeptide/nickel transport system permease component